MNEKKRKSHDIVTRSINNKIKNKKKTHRANGFTLVELIAVIAVLAILVIIGVGYFNNIGNSSKEKAENVLKTSILESARIYTGEYLNEINWTEDGTNKRSCVTINKLVEKGLLKEENNDTLTEYKETHSVEVTGVTPDELAYEYELIDVVECQDLSNLIEANISQTGSTTNTITVEATCSDTGYDIIGYEFSLDRINWSTKTTNKTYTFSNLTIGEYLASVRCTNSISQTKTASTTVVTDGFDRPIFNVTPPSSWAMDKTVTITFPNKPGLICRYKKLTDVSWTTVPCNTKPSVIFDDNGVLLAEVSDGTNDISNTITIEKIKNVAPEITNWSVSPSTWTNYDKTLTVTGKDNSGTGIKGYCILTTNNVDSCTWKLSTSTTYNFTQNAGTYYVYVMDNAGNKSEGKQVSVSMVDKNPPVAVASSPSGSQTFTITGGDTGGSGIAAYCATTSNNSSTCSWNSSTSSSYSYTKSNGTYYGFVRDGAGNISASSSANVYYTPPSYTVYCSASNGYCDTSSRTVTSGSSTYFYVYPNTNYSTSGAYVSGSCSISNNSSYSYITLNNVTSNTTCTVYMTYSPQPTTYYVYYYSGAGYGPSTQSVTSGYGVSLGSASRSGYTFKGWATSSGSTSVSYYAGNYIYPSSNTSLYAVYCPVTYTTTIASDRYTSCKTDYSTATYWMYGSFSEVSGTTYFQLYNRKSKMYTIADIFANFTGTWGNDNSVWSVSSWAGGNIPYRCHENVRAAQPTRCSVLTSESTTQNCSCPAITWQIVKSGYNSYCGNVSASNVPVTVSYKYKQEVAGTGNCVGSTY